MPMSFVHLSFVVSFVKIQDVLLATRTCVGEHGSSISIKFTPTAVASCGLSKAFVILHSDTEDTAFSKCYIACGWEY